MLAISIYTLVDITPTGVISQTQQNLFQRNQQRNWETVQQLVNLRNHAMIVAEPHSPRTVDLIQHKFGARYQGQQKCWKAIFTVGAVTPDNYHKELDRFVYDFDIVPIITGLTETVSLPVPLFSTKGELCNTYFRISE
jgi:hypothetical protein